MHKRILTLSALLVVLFAGSVWLTTDARAADPSPSHSTLAVSTSGTTVDPYQSFGVTITLRDASGGSMTSAPTGKLYLWATDENNQVSSGLDLVELSLGDRVYMHQTSRPGVLIMDAAALIQPQSFNLTLDKKGSYDLHALYMPTGSIDPNAVTNYWPYELNTASITVGATPASDVAMMVVSTKIRGIGVDSFLITNPRNQTLTTPISIDSSGAATTEVQLALLRDNGLSVGADVPVYINTTSNNVTVSNVYVRTDENGIELFCQPVEVACGNGRVVPEFNTQFFNLGEIEIDDFLWQPKARDAKGKHAAGLGRLLENRDMVALLCQNAGAGQ